MTEVIRLWCVQRPSARFVPVKTFETMDKKKKRKDRKPFTFSYKKKRVILTHAQLYDVRTKVKKENRAVRTNR